MTSEMKEAAIRVLMMPRDTNQHGTIFGGVILSHIDQAGAVAAIRRGCQMVVTVAMDQVVFAEPVHVGDLVSFYADLIKVGRTSLEVAVRVEADRRSSGERVVVTTANVTFVNVDAKGKPRAVPSEPGT
ncbi:MAG: acyl-CoA thioesterase YciA [Candidatus Krumholzibacteriia bacterium]|jgi:acyl-CoA thioesterase YciA